MQLERSCNTVHCFILSLRYSCHQLFLQVENDPSEFGLCIVYDNGFKEPCKDEAYPLHQRLKLGPNEDIAKVFVMEASECQDIEVSSEVSLHACSIRLYAVTWHDTLQVQDYIKFSLHELEIFCKKFEEEENKEQEKIKKRWVTITLECHWPTILSHKPKDCIMAC